MQNHSKHGILNKSMEKEMNLKAKPIVDGKFWIVEDHRGNNDRAEN
jgi:hypothetical protein